jgi:transposase-like protein
VKINGEMRYLWRAIDQEGEVIESSLQRHLVDRESYKTRRSAALVEWQSLMA